jgi:hypothetical protein
MEEVLKKLKCRQDAPIAQKTRLICLRSSALISFIIAAVSAVAASKYNIFDRMMK